MSEVLPFLGLIEQLSRFRTGAKAALSAAAPRLALPLAALSGASAWAGLSTILDAPGPAALAMGTLALTAAGLTAAAACRIGRPRDRTVADADRADMPGAPSRSDVSPVHPDWVMLDASGHVRRGVRLDLEGVVDIGRGETLLDRIHLTDRVAFMHALSAARAPGAAPIAVDARLNRAPSALGQAFVPARMVLAAAGRAGEVAVAMAPAGDRAAPDAFGPDTARPDDRLMIVSHELRTPLNAIVGFSELLGGDASVALPVERQREYAGLIHDAATHLLSVVNTMLDVSKLGAGRYAISRESFDLGETVRDVATMLSPRANAKAIHLNLHLEKIAAPAFADRRAVKQIAINLLSNAIKFTPEHGCVTVEAETTAGGLVLVIADTGVGIAADDIAKLGQPFQQVENAYTRQCEGTGLGLSLVRGLAILHGGDMHIESTPSIGTRVTVRLPAADADTGGEVPSSGTVMRLPHSPGPNRAAHDEEDAHAPLRFG